MGALVALALVGCGGGGGGGTNTGAGASATSASQLAQVCAVENTLRFDVNPPTRVGTLADERKWVKAYFDERYLWYRDVPDLDPNAASYNVSTNASAFSNFGDSITNYFNDLRTPLLTPNGQRVDKFSFVTSTWSWNQRQEGESLGYGWQLTSQGTGAARRVWVSYVFPSTQPDFAASAGVQRGDEILSVNGNDINSTIASVQNTVNLLLNPSYPVTGSFTIRPLGSTGTTTVSLVAANVTLPQAEHKVLTDSLGVKWGYLLFNAHVDSAEAPLRAAFSAFQDEPIDQLVLDLRYNGGGYLATASAVSYAIAGPNQTQGKNFETLRYNDKRTAENDNMPFYSTDRGGVAMAALNLSKVYVLTTADTCSASESIINGLRGIGVEVVQIGGSTCGKPYGFLPQDNCGITYAAMEFEGVNHLGQGGFSDGMVPQCAVSDNLSFPLGNPNEPMFATAIAHHHGQPCTSPAASNALSSANLRGMGAPTRRVIRPQWHETKVLKPASSSP